MVLKALVYSKNRAAQLDLLLRSAAAFAPWVEPTVLFTCKPSHQESYEQASAEHIDVPFVWETDFDAQTRSFLRKTFTFMWLVDDAVFYRRAREPDSLPWTCRINGGHRWRDHPADSEQGYPLAVCDTAYKTDTILPLLDFTFHNPNQLERGLHARREWFKPEIIWGESCLYTIEHNAVSDDSWNPTMGGDVDELRDRYTAGERLLFNLPNPQIGPHIQVPLVWK